MRRVYVLALMIACCVIGCIVGVSASIRLASDVPSLLAAGFFPVLGAYLSGVRDRGLLAKVGCYAFVGWLLCFVLEPQVSRNRSMSPSIDDEFGGKFWHLYCFLPSTLLAVVAVLFAPKHLTTQTEHFHAAMCRNS